MVYTGILYYYATTVLMVIVMAFLDAEHFRTVCEISWLQIFAHEYAFS